MTALQKAEQLLAEMTQAEKVRLLQMIAQDLGGSSPGIESTPGICGGAARVAGTRIPVWTLVAYRRQGASEADLLRAYPSLRAEDLAHAWAYYRAYKEEVENQMQENETTSTGLSFILTT